MAKRTMTVAHKEALAAGRKEGHAVSSYLAALSSRTPRRGRQKSPEDMKKRLAEIEETIEEVSPLQALEMAQERRDLDVKLTAGSNDSNFEKLEAEFVKIAKPFSDRKSISYGAWRDRGVPAEVLKKAGVTRG